jgi:hypothetical protein
MGIQGLKTIKAVVGSTIFVLCLLLFYFVHVRFFRVDVVFFSALFDVVLAAAAAGLLLALRYFSVFNVFEKAQLVLIWLMLGYIYAISVPTVIDRSLSFYILEKMQQRGGSLRLDRFEEIFTKEYSREHQLVAVRLTEQQASGTVRIDGDCVILTERGQRLANFSRFFRQYLLPRQRLLMGKYTDQLTDPFRQSADGRGDGCQ